MSIEILLDQLLKLLLLLDQLLFLLNLLLQSMQNLQLLINCIDRQPSILHQHLLEVSVEFHAVPCVNIFVLLVNTRCSKMEGKFPISLILKEGPRPSIMTAMRIYMICTITALNQFLFGSRFNVVDIDRVSFIANYERKDIPVEAWK